jgi:predicted TIM-barrel fold metal-dependent hydrolase
MNLEELLTRLLSLQADNRDAEIYVHDLQNEYMYAIEDVYATLDEDGATNVVVIETDSAPADGECDLDFAPTDTNETGAAAFRLKRPT